MPPDMNNSQVLAFYIKDNDGNFVKVDGIQRVETITDPIEDAKYNAMMLSEPFAELTGTIEMSKKQTKKMLKFLYRDMNRAKRWYRRMKRAKEKARRERLKHHDN